MVLRPYDTHDARFRDRTRAGHLIVRGPEVRNVRLAIRFPAMLLAETNAVLRGSGPVPVEAGRRFRDALVAKGYRVDYTEVPGAAHAPMFWQARLPVGIATLSEGWRRTPADSAARH